MGLVMTKRIPTEDIIGETFGDLVPCRELPPHQWTSTSGKIRSKRMFQCDCSCGMVVTCGLEHLRSGHTQSCGCLAKQLQSDLNTTHGLYKGAGNTNKLHNTFRAMVSRINTNDNYKHLTHSVRLTTEPNYFYHYINSVLGEKPEGFSLDRINNNLGYTEGNLRWASKGTQNLNKRAYGGTSNYKGVCLVKNKDMWVSNITYKGDSFYLGIYESEQVAAMVYIIKWLELENKEVSDDNIRKYLDYFKRK